MKKTCVSSLFISMKLLKLQSFKFGKKKKNKIKKQYNFFFVVFYRVIQSN